MSGASGKVPAAIHVTPEALDGGAIAYLNDGDVVTVDTEKGLLEAHNPAIFSRDLNHPALSNKKTGLGRELFGIFRDNISSAAQGASIFQREQ